MASGSPRIERAAPAADELMVPRPLARPGRFEVDATWGTVQPLQLAPGVRTVAELEVIEHIERGLALVDSRLAHFHRAGTIPGARTVPHEETLARIGELDRSQPTILFCNGPQCTATPDAVHTLLDAGHPAAALLYYRGGMHDWTTLGFPVEPGRG